MKVATSLHEVNQVLRVLYFHQHFITPSHGAGGTRSYEMARALVRRGHSVLMVCGAAEGGLFAIPEVKHGVRRGTVEGIEVLQFCLPYSNYDSFPKRLRIFFRFALRSVQVAFREKYDLLFATSTPLTAALPGIVMKFFRRKPFVFEVRDPWPEVPRAMGIIKNPLVLRAAEFFEWLAYRQADACIGLSPGMVDSISARTSKGKAVTLIPNGCDLGLFRPRDRKDPAVYGLDSSVQFVAIYAGAHGIANGLGAVLDAAACLKRENRNDVALVFVGDGREKPALVRRARDEGLTNCLFLDPMPKERLAELIANANAGLMIFDNIPAFYYGTSPNKFFDYIASGLPVINNYPGWLKDVIEEHQCGIAVPPGDSTSFAAALMKMADGSAHRCKMADNARNLAEQEFDREELALRFIHTLENAASTQSRNQHD